MTRWGWTGPGATFVLALLCGALTLVLATGLWFDRAGVAPRATEEQPITSVAARDDVRELAGPLTERVLSYGWRGFDRRAEAVQGLLGAGYAREYADQMASLRDQVVQDRVTVRASATDVGVVSASADRAVALVYLDQVATAQGSPGRRRDEVRVLVTLTPDGREWRVARIDAF